MSSNTLAIFGDSWACGEVDTPTGSSDSYQVTHAGINEYLSTTFKIQNFSAVGASNWTTLKKINSYLRFAQDIELQSTVLIVQSSPGWMKHSREFGVDYAMLANRHSKFTYFYNELTEIWYIKLQELAEKFNTEFYLLGGQSDLDINTLAFYNRLKCMTESWTKLLYGNHQPTTIPIQPDPRVIQFVKNLNNQQLTKSIMEHYDTCIYEYVEIMNLDTMGPVDFHPNRKGHDVLSNQILFFLKEINSPKISAH